MSQKSGQKLKRKGMEENLYEYIQQILGKHSDKLNILEEQISLDIQLEYFEASKKYKNLPPDRETTVLETPLLFEPETSDEIRKDILVRLASVGDVETYRIIERYAATPGNLKEWAVLAKQESRLAVENALLDEEQVLISSGLGGREGKLRFCVVLLSQSKAPFNAVQEDVIRKEFDFVLRQNSSELEEIEFAESFAIITALVPISLSVREIMKGAVNECNQLGSFVANNFIITNVKHFTLDDIHQFLNEYERRKGE